MSKSSTRTRVKVEGVPATVAALRKIGFGSDKSPLINDSIVALRKVVTDSVQTPTRNEMADIPETGPLSRWNSREAQGMLRGAGFAGKVTRANKNNTRTGASRFPAWDSKTVRAMITRTVYFSRNHYPPSIEASMGNMSAAGAVFEMAGRKHDSQLAQNLSAKYGEPGRALWKQFDSHHAGQQIQLKIAEVTTLVEREVQKSLDAA